jgi:hypothetical protein
MQEFCACTGSSGHANAECVHGWYGATEFRNSECGPGGCPHSIECERANYWASNAGFGIGSGCCFA